MILLDTHTLLWLFTDSASLGPDSRELISSATSVGYSSISVAEVAIKHMLGRLDLPGGRAFPRVFEDMGLDHVPFTSSQAAVLLGEPDLVRHDPFDRLLFAQAVGTGRTLITTDRVLLRLGSDWTHDARR